MNEQNPNYWSQEQESFLKRCKNWLGYEIFSKICIPPETSFFIRLDGWRFKKVSEKIKVEKPFDEKFAKCLVSTGKTLFRKGLNPTLIYVASDELNILFLDVAPFNRRVEKIDSVLAGLVSSAFSVNMQKIFDKTSIIAFDSRIVVASTEEKIIEYLGWRQINNWRNYNNAYAYWMLRKMEYVPSEIAEKLKGLKTKELHEMLFKQGINLSKTPQWQRRGILIHKQPFFRKVENRLIARWKIKEDWNLPLFTSKKGTKLIQQILKWTKDKRKK